MKRILIFTVLILILLPAPKVSAETIEDLQKSGDNLYYRLPPDAKQQINQDDLKLTSKNKLFDIGFYINFITNGMVDIYNSVKKDLGIFLSLALIYMMFSAFKSGYLESYSKAVNIAIFTSMSVCIYSAIRNTLEISYNAINDISIFLRSLLPVMAAAGAASGAITSSTVMHSTNIIFLDAMVSANKYVLIPLCSIMIGFALISSVSGKTSLNSLISSAKTAAITLLTFTATIASAFLLLQQMVTRASDSMTLKVAKLTFTGAIPIIGGAMKDALDTVIGSASIIKTSTGVIGIAVILITLLPAILRGLIYTGVFSLSSSVFKFSDEGELSQFLRNIKDVFSIILALTAIECILLVFSLSLVMTTVSGGG